PIRYGDGTHQAVDCGHCEPIPDCHFFKIHNAHSFYELRFRAHPQILGLTASCWLTVIAIQYAAHYVELGRGDGLIIDRLCAYVHWRQLRAHTAPSDYTVQPRRLGAARCEPSA